MILGYLFVKFEMYNSLPTVKSVPDKSVPDTPDTFPGHIGPFPGLLLMEILIFNQVQETM